MAVSAMSANAAKPEIAGKSAEPASASATISAAFNRAAQWTSRQCGRPVTFALACATVVVWGLTGPVFQYSDTWQLVINTGTTIVTFLMVFLIQNSQNRDTAAIHLKLDELIRVSQPARNEMLDLEHMSEEELERLRKSFLKIASNRSAATTPAAAADALIDETVEAEAEAIASRGR
jgi:low affinity Fe/Cu permease